MLTEFTSWYARQITDLLPRRLRTARAGLADARVVALLALPGAEPEIEVLGRRGHREHSLGRFGLDGLRAAAARAAIASLRPGMTVLRLPSALFLARTIALPLAAEEGLQQVLGFEMDRYTPFTPAEVFWSATVIGRDQAQGRLQARLLLLPRAGLAPLLDALAAIGVRPDVLEAQGDPSRSIALGDAHQRRARRRRRVLLAASALCGGLAIAAAALPFVRQSQAAAAVERRIAGLQPQVNEAEALRRRILAQSAGTDVVASEQARVGDALRAISALTQILPDDTFLTALTLHERQVTIEGQSAAAARLIGSLSTDPVIRNAAFAAPVTRGDNGADIFSIHAEVRP